MASRISNLASLLLYLISDMLLRGRISNIRFGKILIFDIMGYELFVYSNLRVLISNMEILIFEIDTRKFEFTKIRNP